MEQLSQAEIKRRLQQLRNYEKLYPDLKKKYEAEKKRRMELEAELAQERTERQEKEEKLLLRIEQLETMVFGRKNDDDDDPSSPKKRKKKRKKAKNRDAASYRRDSPKDEDVTDEQHHSIDTCPDCGELLQNMREVIRYEEDIVIPALENLKHVIKHHIETGFCPCCRKQFSALPIAKQTCVLGENVRARILYCTTIQRQSYDLLQADLRDTFGIDVSNGEIAAILEGQSVQLLPEYHAINKRIRGSPARHCDETPWTVQKEEQGNYAWVKTASDSPDTIFLLGRSRGKGNAEELCDTQQITVTDDYGAYDFLGALQALCWAHPKRKFQELAESNALPTEKREHCHSFYRRFCKLLKDVKTIATSPYDVETRTKAATRFRRRIATLCVPDANDPPKLATLKATFLQRTEAYLTCVLHPDVPFTNNKAEQALRSLVIKRRLSFGSKTQKGADIMGILFSVSLTTWWRCQESGENIYHAYQRIIRQHQAA